MPRAAVPVETDILCESCGYTLNGLPDDSRCPECGDPIAQSTAAAGRSLTGFEQRTGASSFVMTTLAVLLRPTRFYRGLLTRVSHPAASWFARRHRLIASFFFTLTALGHLIWLESTGLRPLTGRDLNGTILLFIIAWTGLYYLMGGLTRLAAWLSSMEGAYWGMRLPGPSVRRCLCYHSACYLPISVLAATIVWGYRWLILGGVVTRSSGMIYLYTLSGAVIVSAGYLFYMYMIAMRQTRYANR